MARRCASATHETLVRRLPPRVVLVGSRNISVLLRLAPQALSSGRLAGRAEIVETGESTQIRDSEELVAFLRAEGSPERQLGRPLGGEADREAHKT